MEFKIGDRVRIRPYDKMQSEYKVKAFARVSGCDGAIVDIMYSTVKERYVYKVKLDGYDRTSKCEFDEGCLDLIEEQEAPTYEYGFDILENIVIARLYEVTADSRKEICKGHGHIIHDGVLGIAQASSWALKKIYQKLDMEDGGYA